MSDAKLRWQVNADHIDFGKSVLLGETELP
jgi:hypothetical protein